MDAVLQMGMPGSGELAMIAFVALFYAVVIAALIKIARWLIRRETRELRQRVALLEHEVATLEGDERAVRETDDGGR